MLRRSLTAAGIFVFTVVGHVALSSTPHGELLYQDFASYTDEMRAFGGVSEDARATEVPLPDGQSVETRFTRCDPSWVGLTSEGCDMRYPDQGIETAPRRQEMVDLRDPPCQPASRAPPGRAELPLCRDSPAAERLVLPGIR